MLKYINMTIALIHYLQFVCVNCDVHVYKTGIRRAMKKKIIKHTWRTIYTCICIGQCNLISKCNNWKQTSSSSGHDHFFFRFKGSNIATEAMHAFQWPKAHALPPWLQKRTVH